MSGISSPVPAHVVHVAAVMIVPKIERLTSWTSPEPPHRRQAIGDVPGSAPLPMHRSHEARRSTSIELRVPKAASSNVSERRAPASSPRATRVRRGPRRVRVPTPNPAEPKNMSKMSWTSVNGNPAVPLVWPNVS